MFSRHSREKCRYLKTQHTRARSRTRVERAQLWHLKTRSEEEALNICLYIDEVLGISCKCHSQTFFTNAGGDGLPTFYIEVRTLKSLVLEAMRYAEEIEGRRLQAVFHKGQMWTVEQMRAASQPVAPIDPAKPRFSDYLVPVAMFAGRPVYELPSPAEAERILKKIRG